MKTSTKTLLALLLMAAVQLPAQSVPEYVNYQGLLKAADGSPLATGNYTIEFNIYDQANGGTKVWGPFLFDGAVGNGHGPLVPVVNGSFNVIIGPKDTGGASITNAFTGPNRFIEIKVGAGTPILPRQQFLSTAYALQSQKAQLADIASTLVKDLYDALCPPGTIVAFGGTKIPSGWLLCDGRPLTNAMFPNLFAAIGTNWGNGTLDSNGNTENPPNPDTGINLPDLRGTFLRGVNGALAIAPWNDPDAAARSSRYAGNTGNKVGSYQDNKFKPHKHRWAEIDANASRYYRSLYSWDANGNGYQALRPFVAAGAGSGSDDDSFEVSAPANTALYTKTGTTVEEAGETRPNNAYVNYIIKY